MHGVHTTITITLDIATIRGFGGHLRLSECIVDPVGEAVDLLLRPHATSDLAVVEVPVVVEYVGMDGLMALDLLLLLLLNLPVDAKLSLLFIFLSLLMVIAAVLMDESKDVDTRDLFVSSGCFPSLLLVALVMAVLSDPDTVVLVVFTWSLSREILP